MTRILVQRGSSSGSSSNPSRSSSLSGSSSAWSQPQINSPQVLSAVKDEEIEVEPQENVIADDLSENCGSSDNNAVKSDDVLLESTHNDHSPCLSEELSEVERVIKNDIAGQGELMKGLGSLTISERVKVDSADSGGATLQNVTGSSQPPPPPVPPPKISSPNSNSRRTVTGSSNAVRIGPSRRAVAWPVVSTRTSPTGSRPSSPRSHGEGEGYNSADEQGPCFVSSYDDTVSI